MYYLCHRIVLICSQSITDNSSLSLLLTKTIFQLETLIPLTYTYSNKIVILLCVLLYLLQSKYRLHFIVYTSNISIELATLIPLLLTLQAKLLLSLIISLLLTLLISLLLQIFSLLK